MAVNKNKNNQTQSKKTVKAQSLSKKKGSEKAKINVKASNKNKQLLKSKNAKPVNKKQSKAKIKNNVKVSNKNKLKKITTSKELKTKVSVKQKIQNVKNAPKKLSKLTTTSVQKPIQKKVTETIQENKILDIKSAIDKKKTFEQQNNEKRFIESGRKINKTSGLGKNLSFKINDSAVYPSHGVGKIVDVENTEIGGQNFSCYLMYFETEKLTIKIPVSQAYRVGLRALSTKDQMEEVFTILRSGVKKLKGMWSRRAQEYEAKINSGDIMMLAEVLRDLTRDIEDGERSYSERIIYETAIYRLSAEYAAIYGVSFEEGREKVLSVAKDKLGSFDSKVKAKEDDFDFDDEVESLEEEEDDLLEDSDDNDDYDDDDTNAGGKKSIRN